MALDPVPWAVGNGAENSVEGARLSLYASTGGRGGVMSPTDMRVSALPVPGGAVRVHTGGVVIVSGYPGASSQAYAARETSSTDVEIDATGSSGSRTRYLVVRVHDHQYAGESAPESVEHGPYNQYEWISQDPRTSKLPYPVEGLAKVVQPANTATITNDMIEDIREVANPRTLDVWRPRALLHSEDEALGVSSEDGEWFPNIGGQQMVYIPEWATRVLISASWLQIRVGYGEHAYGQMWVEYGPHLRPSTRERTTQRYQWDTVGSRATTYRENWIVEDDCYIPKAYRGTTQAFIMKARRDGSTPVGAVKLDGVSGVSLKLRFLEIADPSST